MNKYEFIAVFDIDEIPVPRKHRKWQDLLESLESNYTQFIFQGVLFPPTKENTYIVDNTLRARKPVFMDGNVKSFYATENTMALHNQHSIASFLTPNKVKRLSESDAHMHHYRECKPMAGRNSCWKYNPVKDNCLANISMSIMKRVDVVLMEVFN